MSCCCIKRLNLCEVDICNGSLVLNKLADAPESSTRNIYTLLLYYLNTRIAFQKEQIEGEKLSFDVSSLNEDFEYEGQIFNSIGERVNLEVDSIAYDCLKFRTIMTFNSSLQTESDNADTGSVETVIIEDVIEVEDPVVTGTTAIVEGLDEDSNTITCDAFAGVRVVVVRGNVPIPGIDPLDGSEYFTKTLNSNFITLSTPLVFGEFIRIQTIPQ